MFKKGFAFFLMLTLLVCMTAPASAGFATLTLRKMQLEQLDEQLHKQDAEGSTLQQLSVYMDGDWMFYIMGDGTAEILRYKGTQTDVTVPETLKDAQGNAYTVSRVSAFAVMDREDVKFTAADSVVIEEMEQVLHELQEDGDEETTPKELQNALQLLLQQLEDGMEEIRRVTPKYDGIG